MVRAKGLILIRPKPYYRTITLNMRCENVRMSPQVRSLKATANGLTDEAASEKYKVQEARRAGEALRSQIVEVFFLPPLLPQRPV